MRGRAQGALALLVALTAGLAAGEALLTFSVKERIKISYIWTELIHSVLKTERLGMADLLQTELYVFLFFCSQRRKDHVWS